MPSKQKHVAGRKTHSNLRPKHRHTKEYLKTYWPYLPLVVTLIAIVSLLSPWHAISSRKDVLAYATNLNSTSLLEATNKQRQNSGSGVLQLNDSLSQAAQAKAEDMAANNYWAHNSPDGRTPWSFIDQTGYEYYKAGENLAYGFSDSNDTVIGWLNSAAHRENMLDSNFSEVGFGYANSDNFNGVGPSTIVVALYAQPAGHSNAPLLQTHTETPNQTNAFTTLSNADSSVQPQSISRIQTITKGVMPWAPYVVGFLIGACVMYLFTKHGLAAKRLIANGEDFIIHHPLLDITLVSMMILGFLISQQVGVIL